jgi:hypothetical protein
MTGDKHVWRDRCPNLAVKEAEEDDAEEDAFAEEQAVDRDDENSRSDLTLARKEKHNMKAQAVSMYISVQ